MMSISEARQLAINKRPVYAKKKIYLYRGQDLAVGKRKPFGTLTAGYVGKVLTVMPYNGIIYLRIDDEQILNDGIDFYIVADKSSIATDEADAPKKEPGVFERIWDTVSESTVGAMKFVAGPIVKVTAIIIGGYLIYKLMGDEAKAQTKQFLDKTIEAGKTAIEKSKKALAK